MNNTTEASTFPKQLKHAVMKQVFRKHSRSDKKNYRPINILPNVSNIYERCLNKYQCGFPKGYSVINALLQRLKNGENISTKVVPLELY